MVKIKYKNCHGEVISTYVDYCSGEIPAYSDEFYWNFSRNKKHVIRVARKDLVEGYDEVAKRLYGKPWRDKLKQLKKDIYLFQLDERDFCGLPNDYVAVYGISGLSSSEFWVIEQESGLTLCVINHKEKYYKAKTFKEALKKCFPQANVRY